jgi:hypothetical protein
MFLPSRHYIKSISNKSVNIKYELPQKDTMTYDNLTHYNSLIMGCKVFYRESTNRPIMNDMEATTSAINAIVIKFLKSGCFFAIEI